MLNSGRFPGYELQDGLRMDDALLTWWPPQVCKCNQRDRVELAETWEVQRIYSRRVQPRFHHSLGASSREIQHRHGKETNGFTHTF